MNRKVSLIAAAAAAALILPGASDAARMGPKLPVESDASLICIGDCTLAQTRLSGAPMKSPFKGVIKRLRIQEAFGSYRLQVLRKREGGRYRAVRQSRALEGETTEDGEVRAWQLRMRIRRGDFIGLRPGGPVSIANSPASIWRSFFPAIAPGSSAKPEESNPDSMMLYNAKVVR